MFRSLEIRNYSVILNLVCGEKVRASIQEHVYNACDPKHWESGSYDDPYDPVIDYEQLKCELAPQ